MKSRARKTGRLVNNGMVHIARDLCRLASWEFPLAIARSLTSNDERELLVGDLLDVFHAEDHGVFALDGDWDRCTACHCNFVTKQFRI